MHTPWGYDIQTSKNKREELFYLTFYFLKNNNNSLSKNLQVKEHIVISHLMYWWENEVKKLSTQNSMSNMKKEKNLKRQCANQDEEFINRHCQEMLKDAL